MCAAPSGSAAQDAEAVTRYQIAYVLCTGRRLYTCMSCNYYYYLPNPITSVKTTANKNATAKLTGLEARVISPARDAAL